jgi:hypothetical protein
MAARQFDLEVVLPKGISIGPFWVDRRARRASQGAFRDLPRTRVCAPESESLRQLLGRAGSRLGVGALHRERVSELGGKRRWSGLRRAPRWDAITSDRRNLDPHGRFEEDLRFAAFVRPGDELSGPAVLRDKRLYLTRVTTVDREGRARWDVGPLDASIGDLWRAGEAGLFDGDPLRPYLILEVPGGDLGSLASNWGDFSVGLRIVWEAVSAVGTLYTASQVVAAVGERLRGSRDVIDARHGEWAARGGRPSDLAQILQSQPRRSGEVADLLGCGESEAEALLWGLGFARGEDGMWRTDSDPTAQLLTLAARLASESGEMDGAAEAHATLEGREGTPQPRPQDASADEQEP